MNAQFVGLASSAIIHLTCILFFVVPLFGIKATTGAVPDSVQPPLNMMISSFKEPVPEQEQVVEPEPVVETEPMATETVEKRVNSQQVVKSKPILKPVSRKVKTTIPLKTQPNIANPRELKQKKSPAVKPVEAGNPAMISMLWHSYKQTLRSTIQQQRRYPLQSRRRHEQGIVIVKFRVDRSGNVSHICVRKSSGYLRLDRAATTAIQSIGRFQSFPAIIGELYREFELPVRFSL